MVKHLNQKRGAVKKDKIDLLLATFPLYSEDFGIDVTEPSGRLKWFLAAILFGARISEKIASNTYRLFDRYGVNIPEKIVAAGWDELVRILDEGEYVRYDFSTATKLLDIMGTLQEKYGSLENLYIQSSDTKDLEKRLQEFKGIGAVTSQIFLRELRGVWDITPKVSSRAQRAAENLDINLQEFEGEALSRLETALVKLSLRYCKKSQCEDCPVSDFCTQLADGC
jgi:endonuclease III